MDLIGLVVAGQGVHHQVDAEPNGHLALALAAGHNRKHRPAELVVGPGGGPVVGADDERRDAVIDAAVGLLHPQIAAGPAAGEILQQIERLRQHVIGRNWDQRRHVQTGDQRAQL